MFDMPLRPPGAVPEVQFRRLCVRCGMCFEACPHRSLRISNGFGAGRHTPYLSPQDTPCHLCMKCVPVCPTGALDPSCRNMEDVRMGTAYILMDGCHNYTNGPMCWTCYDRCPLRGKAIVLKDGLTPVITPACTGCGVCAHVCPKKAVEIVASSAHFVPPNAAPQVK